jgi:hypothetical protein
VAPTTPTPRPAAKAALLSSSEGEAAAATTASRSAAAEGPTTGAGCPAANAAIKSDRIRILRIGTCSEKKF